MNTRALRRRELARQPLDIEAGRHDGAHAPRLAAPPARIAEVVGDRSEGVGAVGHDIGAPVAVAVGGEPQVNAGQELRIAERPGPASLQLRARKAAVGDLEQIDELGGEEVAAAAFPSERGKRLREIEIALDRPIAALVPENGDDDFRRYAVPRLDAAERVGIARKHAPPTLDPRSVDVVGDIGREGGEAASGRAGARLRAVKLDHARAGPEPIRHPRDRRLAHALGACSR